MTDELNLRRKRILDALTNKEYPEQFFTTVRNSTGSSTTLNGANQTLATVVVPKGIPCLITRLYVYGGAATSYTLSYTQTISTGSDTQTMHYSLISAGDEEHVGDASIPLLAMANGTTGNVTITLSVDSATNGVLYQANISYILLNPQQA